MTVEEILEEIATFKAKWTAGENVTQESIDNSRNLPSNKALAKHLHNKLQTSEDR